MALTQQNAMDINVVNHFMIREPLYGQVRPPTWGEALEAALRLNAEAGKKGTGSIDPELLSAQFPKQLF